jgi:GT2 family glycosyltransferase
MTESDLVSVVIPSWNRASSVGIAIDSALGQTHRSVEVLVVDDGSTDGTADVIARRYGREPRVRYLRKPNGGAASARNEGLRHARGAYVAFLDSDDWWQPWKTELQLRCLRSFPEAGMIWTDMEAVDPQWKLVQPRFLRTMYRAAYRWFPTPESLFQDSTPLESVGCSPLPAEAAGRRVWCGDLSSAILTGNLVHTSTVLLRRERLEQVGLFVDSMRFGEDFEFHLRTCRLGPVAFADVETIRYQIGRGDQMIRDEFQIKFARAFLATIEPLLADVGPEVKLPRRTVDTVLAEAHAWIGREALVHGERLEARTHLAESLRHRTLAPATLGLLILACGPDSAFPIAREVVRTAKRVIGRA